MKPEESAVHFHRLIAKREKNPDNLLPEEAVQLMIEFYTGIRCDSCYPPDEDGDALLFQYGVYSFGGTPFFQYDLTRQFIVPERYEEDDEEEQVMSQLRLTLYYEPDAALQEVDAANQWCWNIEGVGALVEFIQSSPATAAVTGKHPHHVSIEWNFV